MNMITGRLEDGRGLTTNSDTRRTIIEASLFIGRIQHFEIHDGSEPLGQHYHRKLREVFYFTSGFGTVSVAPVDESGTICGPIQVIRVMAGSFVEILPMHTHRFDLGDGTRFICFASEAFDPSDIIPCPIEI